jgi:hypothetical protein
MERDSSPISDWYSAPLQVRYGSGEEGGRSQHGNAELASSAQQNRPPESKLASMVPLVRVQLGTSTLLGLQPPCPPGTHP